MTLSPTGTARARFGAPTSGVYPNDLVPALSEHDVDEAWLALAHEIASLPPALADADRRALLLWALALYGALEAGSTRLPDAAIEETLRALNVPAKDAQAAAALAGRGVALFPAIGPPDARTPLVHHDGSLYPRAAWSRESRVGAWLDAGRDRVLGEDAPIGRAIDDVIARPPKLGNQPMKLNALQLAAVRAAARRRLAVISGGPGTGKTSIVVAILRVLVRLGIPRDAIALAAPTGKAKHRLQTSIATSLAQIERPDDADRALAAAVPEALTLHRLLGWQPAHGAFAWTREHRLPYRVVIVDEGSMIDLAMVDHLVEALRDDARLIVLGDADQLPSVDVGAVFRDFVTAGGEDAVRLTESYRMRVDDAAGGRVYQVAQAINAGDVARMEAGIERVSAVPREGAGVAHIELARPTELARVLDGWVEDRVLRFTWKHDYFKAASRAFSLYRGEVRPDDRERLTALVRHCESQRILCVTRSAARPTGVDAVNARVRAHFREARARRNPHADRDAPTEVRSAFWATGDPVLVEHNDYGLDLWNGDFGVVVRTSEDDLDARLVVAFERERGTFVFHPLGALRGLITHAWAMTVHKAQGSELDEAMVVLPWDPIPLMTREIVYTAVSRARRSVLLVGPQAILHRGVERRLDRRSGLVSRARADYSTTR